MASGLNRKMSLFDLFIYIMSTLVLIVVAYPLIYVFSASLSDYQGVLRGDIYLFPINPTLEGYRYIFAYGPIWTGYRNSIFYTSFGTLVNLMVTLPAAFALSRKDLRGRNVIMFLFSFTMFFSGGIIPLYLIVRQLNMTNTVWAMILPVAASVWNIIVTRTYFQSNIPFELQESAYIDGCSTTYLFMKIVLPLSAPIIAVMSLFYAVMHWNSYFNALMFLSDRNTFPLQIILRNILILDESIMEGADTDQLEDFIYRQNLKEVMKFGIVVVSSIPVLILYPFLQKYFVKGIMVGAIKG